MPIHIAYLNPQIIFGAASNESNVPLQLFRLALIHLSYSGEDVSGG